MSALTASIILARETKGHPHTALCSTCRELGCPLLDVCLEDYL